MKYLIIISFLFVGYGTLAKTIPVGKGHPYKTVTAGVEAAQSGDTVLVHAGHYKEKNLVIDKTIVLKGISYPVLDGQNKYEIISIKADGVVVEGLRIINSGVSNMDDLSGIQIYDSTFFYLKMLSSSAAQYPSDSRV